jgi:hypothetical protein
MTEVTQIQRGLHSITAARQQLEAARDAALEPTAGDREIERLALAIKVCQYAVRAAQKRSVTA